MKQWLKKRKGRGFTLVELLIVIVIIGILAGSLLLVMGSGTDKANATKIVSDMRTLKAAALMYYADNSPDWPGSIEDLKEYLDRDPDSSKIASYDLVGEGNVSADLAIKVYNIAEKGIQDRLADMAAESGLYKKDLTNSYSGSETEAYMIVAQ